MITLFYKRAIALVKKLAKEARSAEIPQELRKLAQSMNVVSKEVEILMQQAEFVGSRSVVAEAQIELQQVFDKVPATIAEIIRSGIRRNVSDDEVAEKVKKTLEGTRHRVQTLIRTTELAIAQENVNQEAKSAFGNDESKVLMRYTGPSGTSSRAFCRGNLGVVKTLAEWRTAQNSFGQSVATWVGGYNCRHRLVVVANPDKFLYDSQDYRKIQEIQEKAKTTGLTYNAKDLKDDRKHAEKFGVGLEEYKQEANNIVISPERRYRQNYKGVVQYVFAGEKGYVAVDGNDEIRGYFMYRKTLQGTEAGNTINKQWRRV